MINEGLNGSEKCLADSHNTRLEIGQPSALGTSTRDQKSKRQSGVGNEWWTVEPSVGRVAHGVLKRVDRLRALGNAVVPAQAREAFERLMDLK